jgi:hypothetical protein
LAEKTLIHCIAVNYAIFLVKIRPENPLKPKKLIKWGAGGAEGLKAISLLEHRF